MAGSALFNVFMVLVGGLLVTIQVKGYELHDDEGLPQEDLLRMFSAAENIPEYDLVFPEVVLSGDQRARRSLSSSSSHQLLLRTKGDSFDQELPLQLSINALGNSYSFDLHESKNLVTDGALLVHRYKNETLTQSLTTQRACLYTGRSGSSTIALNICTNMRGIISSPSEELVIEPLPESTSSRVNSRRKRSSKESGPLIVYKRRSSTPCPSQQSIFDRSFLLDRFQPGSSRSFGQSRDLADVMSNSATQNSFNNDKLPATIYIETAVFVDQDLAKHMENYFPRDPEGQLIQVVLAMVNAVQLLYSDGSLGVDVHFVMKRLEILHEDPDGLHRPHDIDLFLTNFCKWQKDENPKGDDNELHWDHALVLTGLDLFTVTTRGRLNAQVVGLAPVAGMCSASSSCTVNEGRHFESVYVVAHEIGHNLGMRHDGSQSGNSCDPGEHLMSPTLGSGKISWSTCSRRYLELFLSSEQSTCLRDVAKIVDPSLDHRGPLLPGERFPADMQCMLKHGPGSVHAATQSLEEICEDLHCRRDHYTWTSHPALEGTTCGQGRWCKRGRCDKKSFNKESTKFNHKISLKHRHQNKFFDSRGGKPALPSRFTPGIAAITPSTNTKPSVFIDTSTQVLTTGTHTDNSWSECHSSCLYGVDGVLSSGSVGLQKKRRTCSTCRGQLEFRTCSAVRQCSTGNRLTIQDYANNVCKTLRNTDIRYSGFAPSFSSVVVNQCRVSCELSDKGSTLSSKWYPDGTSCILGTGKPAYCITGVCTEFSCEDNTQYKADGSHCSLKQRIDPISAIHENENWGPWEAGSSCRTSCIANSKGIELVSRQCINRARGCRGLSKNIRLCTPPPQDCHVFTPVFQHATDVCKKFQRDVTQLSGVGMQLASTPSDPDRACTVACQDLSLHYRFYRVNGREGWFPFGTDCSGGRAGSPRHCLNGKCLDFGSLGIPLQNSAPQRSRSRSLHLDLITEDVTDLGPLMQLSSRLQQLQKAAQQDSGALQRWRTRIHKQLIDEHLRTRRWSFRKKRSVVGTSHRLPGTIDDEFLISLVDLLNLTISDDTNSSAPRNDTPFSSIDLHNPIFDDLQLHEDSQTESTNNRWSTEIFWTDLDNQTEKKQNFETKNSSEIFETFHPLRTPNTKTVQQQSNSSESTIHLFKKDNPPVTAYLMKEKDDFRLDDGPVNRGKSFRSTLFGSGEPDHHGLITLPGKWRVQKTPCSVTCGQGLMEVLVTCVPDDERENDNYFKSTLLPNKNSNTEEPTPKNQHNQKAIDSSLPHTTPKITNLHRLLLNNSFEEVPKRKVISTPSFSSNSQLTDIVSFKRNRSLDKITVGNEKSRVQNGKRRSKREIMAKCNDPMPEEQGYHRCFAMPCSNLDPEPSPALSAWLSSLIQDSG